MSGGFLSPDDANYFSCGAERLRFAWTQVSVASTQKVKMQLSLQSSGVSVRLLSAVGFKCVSVPQLCCVS